MATGSNAVTVLLEKCYTFVVIHESFAVSVVLWLRVVSSVISVSVFDVVYIISTSTSYIDFPDDL